MKLVDVYPDGREILLLDSIQRVKLRCGLETPDLLPPGEVGELEIALWSMSIVFARGHRIGLHISSSNYPRFEKNPNTGDDFPSSDHLRTARNSVYFGPGHPSALVLPLRP
ncbi:MAG: CocE/NonD family hydrolase [Pirellulaceae bacterium]